MYDITPSLLSRLSSRVASRFIRAAGDGTRVGLFIRIPEGLAEQFPERPSEDTSAPHVTLLYVGSVTKDRETEFLEVLHNVLSGWGPVEASFDGLDHFAHPEKDRTVFFARVKFDRDMGSLRDRLTNHLEQANFQVDNSFPLAFNPHATLDYVDGLHDVEYVGRVPDGSWVVDQIEVWGLPGKEPKVELGGHHIVNTRVGGSDKIPGGLADKKQPSDFPPDQLQKGIKVEMEHTDDPALAKEIAMDHLTEDSSYYDKLEEMEKKASALWGEALPVQKYPHGFHPNLIDRGIQVEMVKMAGEDSDVIFDTVIATLDADINAYNG